MFASFPLHLTAMYLRMFTITITTTITTGLQLDNLHGVISNSVIGC